MHIQVTCATSKCKPIRFKFCMRGFPITTQYHTKSHSKISIFNFSHVCYWHPNLQPTGWSINNRTILNCSHFLARRYIFFYPFSPKWSIHTGKLRQQHEFTNASFIILVRCHFVSPYHVDGSANNVLCRGGHFCEIAGITAQWISWQVQLEQENSLNSLKRYPKTPWAEGSRHFERKECFWSEARPAGRRPWQRMKKAKIEAVCPAEPQAPAESQVLKWRLKEFLSVQAGLAQIQWAFTLAIFQKLLSRHRTLFAEPPIL